LREAETQGATRGSAPAPSACFASFSCLVSHAHRISPRGFGSVPLIVLALCAPLFSSNLLPAQSKPSEYAVKAAYLLNFGKFMRVSPGAKTNPNDFNICVVGDDPFGVSLDNITADEKVDGRPVRVVRLQKSEIEKTDSRQCAIAYLSISEEKRMEPDLAAFQDSDTLTVSDAPDFLKRGGMIQFLLASNHVRFSVDLDPVRRTHLNLSSELLRVAASVSGNRPGEVQP
jgi:YfiR/HmsC-like